MNLKEFALTYLEFLHRLQLKFISDSRPLYHLCDIASGLPRQSSNDTMHVLRFKEAVTVIIRKGHPMAYTVEDHLELEVPYSINYHTLYPSGNWQACTPAYYFRLKLLNDFIKEEEANVQSNH
jgi:hypothetical protein